MPVGTAMNADLFHTPDYVRDAHGSGVNVLFVDGHVSFHANAQPLLHNDLTLPTSLLDNPIIMKLWQWLDAK